MNENPNLIKDITEYYKNKYSVRKDNSYGYEERIFITIQSGVSIELYKIISHDNKPTIVVNANNCYKTMMVKEDHIEKIDEFIERLIKQSKIYSDFILYNVMYNLDENKHDSILNLNTLNFYAKNNNSTNRNIIVIYPEFDLDTDIVVAYISVLQGGCEHPIKIYPKSISVEDMESILSFFL